MNYISYINSIISDEVSKREKIVLFGQNISAGSCISGFTRGLKPGVGSMIINTPNVENTQTGLGFGLMLGGVSSVFFVKQLDFLLLGMDHIVNTYNLIRKDIPKASFTIMPVVVDSGYEGPQSSCNHLSDFCSISHADGFTITNKHDADYLLKNEMFRPGFRIIAVSQRLFKTNIIEFEKEVEVMEEGRMHKYLSGKDALVVCFNFSLPQGLELCSFLNGRNVKCSLVSVNTLLPFDWNYFHETAKRSGRKVIILDDSKSANVSSMGLRCSLLENGCVDKMLYLKREFSEEWFIPNPDSFVINHDHVINFLI
jgi:pyruvate/2-oxoglutarate/acetoin dehydrogenase E1 component